MQRSYRIFRDHAGPRGPALMRPSPAVVTVISPAPIKFRIKPSAACVLIPHPAPAPAEPHVTGGSPPHRLRGAARPGTAGACDSAVQASDATSRPAPPAQLPVELPELDRSILGILVSDARPGECLSDAFQRKERELAAIFAELSATAASALHRRLSHPASDDSLALRFGRLIVDRRMRLLAFLADAPRREALTPVLPRRAVAS